MGLLSCLTVPLLFFTRNEAQGAHPWLEIYPVSKFQSDWYTECNASLAEEKKETNKQTKNMKNPVFHMLSSSPFYTYLLTLSIVPSSSNGSPKHLYTLRIPERARFTKFWRVCCFRLSTRVTGQFPIFRLVPTYEVLVYFIILQ